MTDDTNEPASDETTATEQPQNYLGDALPIVGGLQAGNWLRILQKFVKGDQSLTYARQASFDDFFAALCAARGGDRDAKSLVSGESASDAKKAFLAAMDRDDLASYPMLDYQTAEVEVDGRDQPIEIVLKERINDLMTDAAELWGVHQLVLTRPDAMDEWIQDLQAAGITVFPRSAIYQEFWAWTLEELRKPGPNSKTYRFAEDFVDQIAKVGQDQLGQVNTSAA